MYLCIYVGCSMKSNTLIERNETNTLCRNYFVLGKKKKKEKRSLFQLAGIYKCVIFLINLSRFYKIVSASCAFPFFWFSIRFVKGLNSFLLKNRNPHTSLKKKYLFTTALIRSNGICGNQPGQILRYQPPLLYR